MIQTATDNASDHRDISYWRQYIKHGQASLKADFTHKPNTAILFKRHAKLIDGMLAEIWLEISGHEKPCLIAVGGYGRGELYPYSDIDLLILVPEHQASETTAHTDALNNSIETLIGRLWDIGLNVGHSVRTLSECIVEAKKDITVQTNLTESRRIAGNKALYACFLAQTAAAMDPQAFLEAKLKEQHNRHAKFNDTAYNLEPNIKESPGGLRDLHMILWLFRSQQMLTVDDACTGNHWPMLVKMQLISTLEARQIRHHEQHLQRLRTHLHLMSGRREDRLLFDFQNTLASTLGYVNTPRKRASEQLMQSYYRSVKFVLLMNEILLKSLQQRLTSTPVEVTPINNRFEAHDHLLMAKHAGLFQQLPNAILEAFLLLQQHPELKGMSAPLLRQLQRVKKLVNRDFRQEPANKRRFLEILSQPEGVSHALKRMNRYGILGCYIPAFGKIIGQMQHDLFHVYTVDEHILNVLTNLRRFAKPALKHEFPLCSQLFASFDKPHLLYLAALFHDIAKGRGGDHSTLGTLDAAKFCKQHALNKADTSLVAWLVASHLKMSATAQKTDLSDPSVIATFAAYVGNEERLIALYLLTVADIRGTSPAVWNAWKARLLESLFDATLRKLTASNSPPQATIDLRKAEAADKLQNFGLSTHSYQSLWEKFGAHYFTRYESEEIAWQSRLLTPHLNSEVPIVRARLSRSGDGIQIMIYTKDQHDLFARICNFFDRMGYNIVEAKIYTTSHGYALNSFIVLDQSGKSVSYSGLLSFIEVELTLKLDQHSPLESPLKGRISRQVKHMPIDTKVTVTHAADSTHHQLEIVANDRPGLLATLARQFLLHEIELHNAKINTLGNRAEDIFLISARKGRRLDDSQVKAIQAAITTDI